METLIRFGNERQDGRRVEKVRHEGIERSLKKFKVLEVLEKKQRLANIATEHRENT